MNASFQQNRIFVLTVCNRSETSVIEIKLCELYIIIWIENKIIVRAEADYYFIVRAWEETILKVTTMLKCIFKN